MSRAASQSTSPPLRVLARVPSSAAGSARTLGRSLEAVFEKTCQQIGLPRGTKIEIGVSETGAFEVFADDRPVAIVPLGPTAGQVDSLVDATHWALLRRLPILLHDVDVVRLSPALGMSHAGRSREVLEYVLSNGVSLDHLAELVPPTWPDEMRTADVAEALLDLLPASVSVSVPESILSGLVEADLAAVGNVRQELLHSLGAGFPDLQLSIEDSPLNRTRLFLNNVEGPWVRLAAGTDWNSMVATLQGLLLDHASWFVRTARLAEEKSQVANLFYDLVEISDLNVSDSELTGCVRCLLANRDSVRNLPRVLWHLIEASRGREGVDEVLLAEPHMITPSQSALSLHPHPELSASEVRRGIAYEDWSGGAGYTTPCVSVHPDVETALIDADTSTLGAAEWRALRTVFALGDVEVVAAHAPIAIARLRQALYCLPDPPRVIATRELTPDQRPPDAIDVEKVSA